MPPARYEIQAKHAFAMTFFFEVASPRTKQIGERNHSDQFGWIVALADRHAGQSRFGHPIYDETQRLVRKRGDDLFLHRLAKCQNPLLDALNILARDHAGKISTPANDRIEMLCAV